MNYSQDANCQGYWPQECEGTETAIVGSDMLEYGGVIPRTTDKVWGTYSRDYAAAGSANLRHADGLETDIHGENQPLSIVCWEQYATTTISGDDYIVGKYRTTGDKRQYRFGIDANDFAQFTLSSGGDDFNQCQGATDIVGNQSPTTWYCLIAVYNDTDMRIYLDGSLDANGADNPKVYSGGIVDEEEPFNIGAMNDNAAWFYGDIDEVAIFDRELTSVEVSDIHTNGITGPLGPPTYDRLRKDFISGYHCFMSAYMNAKVLSYEPLKLPDGTTW